MSCVQECFPLLYGVPFTFFMFLGSSASKALPPSTGNPILLTQLIKQIYKSTSCNFLVPLNNDPSGSGHGTRN
ncbi:hypothetical protein V8E53_005994 [Lactarius tabidus]